ncbi:MAG TPA: alpha/beta hydrolase-fold protein [Bacteroidota bacterium]|nr:alpha/beta hydrolase-fold protein [Bacteroidota bacterium]
MKGEWKRRLVPAAILLSIAALATVQSTQAQTGEASGANLSVQVSFSSAVSATPLTGRMFVVISRKDTVEPRLRVGRYGVQLFGVDFVNLQPGKQVTIDASTLGYPVRSIPELAPGDYTVQAVLDKYTEFKRSDGHILWMHMDQWEGQDWRLSPGNSVSDLKHLTIRKGQRETMTLSVNRMLPPIEAPKDTRWVKRIKIQSAILTKFWGQPIYLGATILLPKGYDEHPTVYYPTVYDQGHFSLAPPLRFRENSDTYREWMSDDFPRFIVVTLQHPSPYFDDSYAVNSPNNGPYGDAIHTELIPEIEKQFRCIPKSYARVLTGGSTGGWESFALQVLYPDFYGGTWSFSPDPLDFRNVEGINIYKDRNAFYKTHEWYNIPTVNTRSPETGEAVLTSQQRNTMELVKGTHGRSGEQLDIWSAVFGPVGDDGYFKPLFNKHTGEIDSSVAVYWKEHFDLRNYLQTHWKEVGPKLVGKLHVFCGRMDDFSLNFGVYYMEEFLESTRDPYYAGTVSYGQRGGHGWRPMTPTQLLRVMADHITQNAPPGSDVKAWKY